MLLIVLFFTASPVLAEGQELNSDQRAMVETTVRAELLGNDPAPAMFSRRLLGKPGPQGGIEVCGWAQGMDPMNPQPRIWFYGVLWGDHFELRLSGADDGGRIPVRMICVRQEIWDE